MFIKRVRSEGLAHISYFMESNGEAAVIDPRRDVDEYLELSRSRGARIVLVLETHRNEDYVSGALELANATGAGIYHGGQLEFGYGNPLNDGQDFVLGDLMITALHTPGHTYESHSYLVADKRGPFMLFSGDTMLSGDVGRTDLAGPEHVRELTEMLYETLQRRVLPLGKEIMVLPAHGAGSVCGHAISDRETTTIGLEVRDNRILALSRMDFVMGKMAEVMEKPPYFERMEALNLQGPIILGPLPIPPSMRPKQVQESQGEGSLVLDLREPHSYAAAHIPRSLNVWLDGLPVYGGYAIPYGRPLVLVGESSEHVRTAVRYLVRLGYEDVIGQLRHGMGAWIKGGHPLSSLPAYSVQEIRAKQLTGVNMLLVDLRDRRELEDGAIPGAKVLHLGELIKRSSELPADRELVLFCGSGYRGGIAASLLRNSGIKNVGIMLGGFQAWKRNDFPVEKFKNE
ncbi:MAG TPA: MBL fold metallo-hydrolase [Methanomassiliicoccales archaeon]|nr:MBL fold metallo-hydrolase [Methanomassiliicoccales archaeon]